MAEILKGGRQMEPVVVTQMESYTVISSTYMLQLFSWKTLSCRMEWFVATLSDLFLQDDYSPGTVKLPEIS